jgi:hypothetical protein
MDNERRPKLVYRPIYHFVIIPLSPLLRLRTQFKVNLRCWKTRDGLFLFCVRILYNGIV